MDSASALICLSFGYIDLPYIIPCSFTHLPHPVPRCDDGGLNARTTKRRREQVQGLAPGWRCDGVTIDCDYRSELMSCYQISRYLDIYTVTCGGSSG